MRPRVDLTVRSARVTTAPIWNNRTGFSFFFRTSVLFRIDSFESGYIAFGLRFYILKKPFCCDRCEFGNDGKSLDKTGFWPEFRRTIKFRNDYKENEKESRPNEFLSLTLSLEYGENILTLFYVSKTKKLPRFGISNNIRNLRSLKIKWNSFSSNVLRVRDDSIRFRNDEGI